MNIYLLHKLIINGSIIKDTLSSCFGETEYSRLTKMFLYQIILITTTTSIKTKGTENLTEISKSIDTYQYLILRYPSDNKQLLLSFHTQKRKN